MIKKKKEKESVVHENKFEDIQFFFPVSGEK